MRRFILIHWCLVMPYGDIDWGQHWLRYWRDAWRQQAITCTKIDMISKVTCGIHLRPVSYEDMKILIGKIRFKREDLKNAF